MKIVLDKSTSTTFDLDLFVLTSLVKITQFKTKRRRDAKTQDGGTHRSASSNTRYSTELSFMSISTMTWRSLPGVAINMSGKVWRAANCSVKLSPPRISSAFSLHCLPSWDRGRNKILQVQISRRLFSLTNSLSLTLKSYKKKRNSINFAGSKDI